MQRLKEAAEKAKIELNPDSDRKCKSAVHHGGCAGPRHHDKEADPPPSSSRWSRIWSKDHGALPDRVKERAVDEDGDEVILVRRPDPHAHGQQAVKDLFGKEAAQGVKPRWAVAVGAAIQAGVARGDVRKCCCST